MSTSLSHDTPTLPTQPIIQVQDGGRAEITLKQGKKRVRIAEPFTGKSTKKRKLLPKLRDEFFDPRFESEDSPLSEGNDLPRNKEKRGKAARHPDPTLLERLTGLTGDPNDPIYQPPLRKRGGRVSTKHWSTQKPRNKIHVAKEKKYPEILDPVDKFKKLCLTLVIASCMSGENSDPDWNIVSKVYSDNVDFDVRKTKRLWLWIQRNVATVLSDLTEAFQTSYLEAYEDGKVASIEDPETHDWASLVQWALRNCKYPDPPLPTQREALREFSVDQSNYETLDRAVWYRDNLASTNRSQRLMKYTFASPLHKASQSASQGENDVLKARSWIRSNTTTPQTLYDGNKAHDKIRILGEPALARVVTEFVHHKMLRMRKIKRLLPGRNYNFTAQFAKSYRHHFELSDFMAAARLKKDLDAAFANENATMRTFSISRSAEDGVVMAIMSLVADGRVKLVPRLPPINSDFKAPLPRLSVWGFCEGDYVHRAIDRQRLFWPIDVVPTSSYQFGNPLLPSPWPPSRAETGEPTVWPRLPDPPLPGKNDPDALLPVWSSIDGQSVTWPWWYRILNLVIQPLIFQPGATATDLYRHCPQHTTEVFEIELVLSWLESVNAVRKTVGGGFQVNAGFWAVFGDALLDSEDDWFGEHVKRKKSNQGQWREEYNLRFSTLQQGDREQQVRSRSEEPEEEEDDRNAQASLQILQNSRRQYRIARQTLAPAAQAEQAAQANAPTTENGLSDTLRASESSGIASQVDNAVEGPGQDMEMIDADIDAEGDDLDAEGEIDEEFSPA